MTGEKFLTVKDVASRYGVARQTVHRWLLAGKLKGFRLGFGAWKIPVSELGRIESGAETDKTARA